MALQGFIKSRAYLVGIDEYAAPVRKLHTAVNDVKAIASCLPDFDNIAPPFQNPTVEDFKKILGRIIEEVNDEANPADRVFIYFAGHGKVVYNKENTPKGYLLFKNRSGSDYDSCSFAIEDLIKALETLQCRHLLLVLDCCFSGVVQWAINSRFTGHKDGLRITDPLYRLYTKNNAWQVITSSSYNQETIDSWGLGNRNALDGETNSPFAGIFINALSGVKKNEYFRNNIISSRKLHDYLTTELTGFLKTNKLTHEQSPGIFSLPNDKQGQFVFSVMSLTGKALPFDFEEIQFTNPYKGLQYYDMKDAAYFFGRDEQIGQFEAYAAEDHDFFVTGPSGIGKSSLVRAGFIPRLHIPEEHIFITRVANCGSILEKMRSAAATNNRAVVFIDQFEEILTFKKDDPVIGTVNEIIREGLAQKNLYLIIAARSDKAYQLFDAEHIELGRDQLKEIYVSHPNAGEIEDIIVRPALKHAAVIRSIQNEHRAPEHININADKAFLQRIVQNYSQPGNLPFLSTAMYHWFRHSVHEADEPRMLKQSNWEKFADIEDVFNQIMEEVEAKHGDRFRQFMFRAVEYNTVNSNKTTNKPLRRSFTRRDIGIEDPTLYLDLENARVIRQTGTEKKEETSGTETETYELAHDSIIEKWLVNKSWFKERKNKEQVINAHNKMLLSYADWKEHAEEKKYLWHKNPDLQVIKKDYLDTETDKDSIAIRLFSIISWNTPVPRAPNNYYTESEKDYVIKSIQKKRFISKIPVLLALPLLLGLTVAANYAIGLIQNQKTRNQVNRYIEKSKLVGETEALFLLKEADKLLPGDSAVENAMYELLNSNNYIGNPFAIAITDIDGLLSRVDWDSIKNKIYLYPNTHDSIEWDFATSQNAGVRIKLESPQISDVRLTRGFLTFTYNKRLDTIQFKDESIVDYKITESGDSIYILTDPYKFDLPSKLYCFSANLATKSLVLKRVCDLKESDALSFSSKKYVYLTTNDEVCLYNLSGKLIAAIPSSGGTIDNQAFSINEDKFFVELRSQQGHSIKFSLEIADLRPQAKQPVLPAILGSVNNNFIFKNDSTVFYRDSFGEIRDSGNISYITCNEFNINTGRSKDRRLAIPKGFNLLNSFIRIENINGVVLRDGTTKQLYLSDSCEYTLLGYEGEYEGIKVIQKTASTLLLVRSKQSGLYFYTLYDITSKPRLIHKSSFSLELKKVYCIRNQTMLAIEFINNKLALFDLTEKLKPAGKVEISNDNYKGVAEISRDSFILYSAYKIYPLVKDLQVPKSVYQVLNKKNEFIFYNIYNDDDEATYKDSAYVFNCRTGRSVPIRSDKEKMEWLFFLSGFRFQKSEDSIFIDLPGNLRHFIYSIQENDDEDYFRILADYQKFVYQFPCFIKIENKNLLVGISKKSVRINKTEFSAPYVYFSDITMPVENIVTGSLFDSTVQSRRFFYWNIDRDTVFTFFSPSTGCPYFSVPTTSQIVFADLNKVIQYDFSKQKIRYSILKKNTVQNLFLLSDGLRYMMIDIKNNLSLEFLPDKIRQVISRIKTPEHGLEYLLDRIKN